MPNKLFLIQQFIIFQRIFFLFWKTANAQELPKTLNAEQVLELVRNFHPVTKQATIQIEKSKAEILNARGNFDPILSVYATQKVFD